MKDQRKAYLFATGSVLCWSTIGAAFKISLRHTGFISILLISSLTAVLVLLMILMIRRKTGSLKHLTLRDLALSAVMGLLNPFLYYLVLLRAYDLLLAQEAGTLNYIWPVVLVLLSTVFLRQKISIWSVFAILISFTGIIIISTRGDIAGFSFTNPTGVLLAVGSAIFWALYWILNLKDKREETSKLFLNFVFGFLYILILYFVIGDYRPVHWKGIMGGIYLGIFEMGLTFVLWLNALRYSATTAKVSNLIYLSPFISLVIIHFVVGEVIYLSTLVGLTFIVAGILFQHYLRK
jgi:drug/metabolite transporter (DMT)-like permease